jgi:hypothetical protein
MQDQQVVLCTWRRGKNTCKTSIPSNNASNNNISNSTISTNKNNINDTSLLEEAT